MLTVDNLDTYYGASQALFGLGFAVAEGEVVTLLGRNGMGKTTAVNSVMGVLRPRAGQIAFQGQRTERLPAFRIARLGLGLVPEGRQIFPNLSARENLLATAAAAAPGSKHQPWTLARVLEMFPALTPRLEQMGNLLSGGEQQMLAIARALMTNPKLLILDEATEGLAPLVRRDIWACLASLKNQGMSILLIDKNLDDLARIADRHYVIEKGKTVWQGDSTALQNDRQSLLERYLSV